MAEADDGGGPSSSSAAHPPFIEVLSPHEADADDDDRRPPDEVECYVSTLTDPKKCGLLLKALSACAPLHADSSAADTKRERGGGGGGDGDGDDGIGGRTTGGDVGPSEGRRREVCLGHLKRVRRMRRQPAAAANRAAADRRPSSASAPTDDADPRDKDNDNDDGGVPPPTKRKKRGRRGSGDSSGSGRGGGGGGGPPTLEVLFGTAERIDRLMSLAPPAAADDTSASAAASNGGDGKSNCNGSSPKNPEGPAKSASILRKVLLEHSLSLEKRTLPGRLANSQSELDEWNDRNGGSGWWPTLHRKERTDEFKEGEKKLSREEMESMGKMMREAIEDARRGRDMWERWRAKHRHHCNKEEGDDSRNGRMANISGCIIVDPTKGEVVSRASDERRQQMMLACADVNRSGTSPPMQIIDGEEDDGADGQDCRRYLSSPLFPDEINPLSTSVLLAIQGVSRRERCAASSLGMAHPSFQRGQYLCTGYDVYATIEPGPFESMALVHNRAHGVIYGAPDMEGGGLGSHVGVHALPGTNHRYRAFRCASSPPSSEDDGGGVGAAGSSGDGGNADGGGEANGAERVGDGGSATDLLRACRELHPATSSSSSSCPTAAGKNN